MMDPNENKKSTVTDVIEISADVVEGTGVDIALGVIGDAASYVGEGLVSILDGVSVDI